jgi:hypothetical protein
MRSYRKRFIISNCEILINRPFSINSFEGCEKCNNYPSLDENYCGLCGKKIYDGVE